jgi:NADH-quinone oxidoreductase subunit N
VCRRGERYVEIQDFSGLAVRRPRTAAMDANLVWLAVLGLLTSVVAAYYYLRIIVVMYMHEPEETSELPPLTGALSVALYASAIGTLLLGVHPSLILDFVNTSAILAR